MKIKATTQENPGYSHYFDPITPSLLNGNSRKHGDADATVKAKVMSEIISQAREYGLSNTEIGNILAIAKLESGFNPDAATNAYVSSASGVLQITD